MELVDFLHENYVYPVHKFSDEDLTTYLEYQRGTLPLEDTLKYFRDRYFREINRSDKGFNLTAPQTEFMRNNERDRAFVAGFSSGKTETLIISVLQELFFQKDVNVRLDVYAPTLDLLKQTSVPRLLSVLEQYGYTNCFNKADMVLTIPKHGQVFFKTLSEPDRIVGYESLQSFIDEFDTLPTEHAKNAWSKIIGRTRQRVRVPDSHWAYNDPSLVVPDEFEPSIRYRRNRNSIYTTPEGFKFTYDKFGVGHDGLVLAATYSNPFIPPDYINQLLEQYPKELVDAYIRGRFVNLTAGSAWFDFTRDENVRIVPPPDKTKELHIGMDFNVENMACVVSYMEDGVLRVFREFHHVLDTPTMITSIKSAFEGYKITIYPDSSGGNRKSSDASVSDIKLLYQAGFQVRVPPKNPPVKDRWVSTNKAFELGKVHIDKACVETIKCLEFQTIDKNTALPNKREGHDHQTDALSYLVFGFFPINRSAIQRTRVIGV